MKSWPRPSSEPVLFDDRFDQAALPLAAYHRTGAKLPTLSFYWTAARQLAMCVVVEAAMNCGLKPPGNHMTEEIRRPELRGSTEAVLPECPQALQREPAQTSEIFNQLVLSPHSEALIR